MAPASLMTTSGQTVNIIATDIMAGKAVVHLIDMVRCIITLLPPALRVLMPERSWLNAWVCGTCCSSSCNRMLTQVPLVSCLSMPSGHAARHGHGHGPCPRDDDVSSYHLTFSGPTRNTEHASLPLPLYLIFAASQ
jgi:hypothetical protein